MLRLSHAQTEHLSTQARMVRNIEPQSDCELHGALFEILLFLNFGDHARDMNGVKRGGEGGYGNQISDPFRSSDWFLIIRNGFILQGGQGHGKAENITVLSDGN